MNHHGQLEQKQPRVNTSSDWQTFEERVLDRVGENQILNSTENCWNESGYQKSEQGTECK